MKHSDLAVVAAMYAVCAFFGWQALTLPDEARTYPLCLLAGLGLLNTLLLGRCLWRARREGLIADLPAVFQGFLGRQFLVVLLASAACLALLPAGGFYLTGLAYLAGVLLFLRVPATHAILTAGTLFLMIWAVFSLFLKVPLPGGILLGG